ncbi:MAG: Apre_1838 family putative sactipeptide bacteriocin [Lachnospiraceae bacterium]|nr:Apre_1838 family putative sactipeptide bacteriocin [Lachnospiraceae bacterium]
MELINPVGSQAIGGEAQPMACMCSTKKAFANSKGSDGCFHCGCSCNSQKVNAGNSSTAFWTIRSSGSFE